MADLQKQFEQFHEDIALERDKEMKTLVEKRERILTRLSEGIARQRQAGAKIPSYSHRNQGSYAMGTGIKPLDGDYDIDVALTFDVSKDDHPNPVAVKRWVYDALLGHTKEVRMCEPCVTVVYQREGEPVYHVDLAVYARDEARNGKSYLARGKLGSGPEHRSWEESDPAAFIDAIETRFADPEDRAQLRRVIQYLKRWKDEQFSSEGQEAPRGIALTACAYEWFQPVFRRDAVANRRSDDDMRALQDLVIAILARYVGDRLSVVLPVPPHDDLFARMSDEQLRKMKVNLTDLRDALQGARDEIDPRVAAEELAKRFGEDFPVPDAKDTGVKRAAAIVSSGHSA